MKIACNRLLSLTYDIELIKIMSENIRLSVLGANFITPLIAMILLSGQIPQNMLFIWFLINLSVLVFRFLIGKKLRIGLNLQDEHQIEKYFRLYLLFIAISGLLWSFLVILTIYFSTEVYVLVMLTVIFGLTSGSVSTLGAIFHAMFLFSISIFIPTIIALVSIKYNPVYIFEAIFSISYIFITTKAFYANYMVMKKNIEKQYELEIINRTLENRIKKEVEKNREKERYLLQQNRLAQMGELISMIAHQWRQPLSSISSISSALELKAELGNLKKEFILKSVESIKKYVTYLSTTIDDFRAFFKDDKKKQKTTVKQIVDNSLAIIGEELKHKNIKLVTKIDATEEICVYANELQQVLINLIKNAEDALFENGIENKEIKIRAYEDEKKVVLSVEDNAGGIPEEVKFKIFDPYFSTKLKKDGTGLGLYMSKIIVEEHSHGRLYFKNTNKGAQFFIELYKEDNK